MEHSALRGSRVSRVIYRCRVGKDSSPTRSDAPSSKTCHKTVALRSTVTFIVVKNCTNGGMQRVARERMHFQQLANSYAGTELTGPLAQCINVSLVAVENECWYLLDNLLLLRPR